MKRRAGEAGVRGREGGRGERGIATQAAGSDVDRLGGWTLINGARGRGHDRQGDAACICGASNGCTWANAGLRTSKSGPCHEARGANSTRKRFGSGNGAVGRMSGWDAAIGCGSSAGGARCDLYPARYICGGDLLPLGPEPWRPVWDLWNGEMCFRNEQTKEVYTMLQHTQLLNDRSNEYFRERDRNQGVRIGGFDRFSDNIHDDLENQLHRPLINANRGSNDDMPGWGVADGCAQG